MLHYLSYSCYIKNTFFFPKCQLLIPKKERMNEVIHGNNENYKFFSDIS